VAVVVHIKIMRWYNFGYLSLCSVDGALQRGRLPKTFMDNVIGEWTILCMTVRHRARLYLFKLGKPVNGGPKFNYHV